MRSGRGSWRAAVSQSRTKPRFAGLGVRAGGSFSGPAPGVSAVHGGLTTDGSGTATFAIPVTLPMFTIVFTTADATFNAGGLDPTVQGGGLPHACK
jgi:hypothetical protein